MTTSTTTIASATPYRGASSQISPTSNGHQLPSIADCHHRSTDLADGAGDIAALRVENANLRAQLASLPVIEQAKGILIGRYQISPDAAFALLQRWSSHTNLKLRHISGLLVHAARHPDGEAPGRDHPGRDLEQLIDWLKAAAKPDRQPHEMPCAQPGSRTPTQRRDDGHRPHHRRQTTRKERPR